MRTISELSEHINKHKDAVIITGKEINSNLKAYNPDDFNKLYSRKALKRYPDKLWQFYQEFLYSDFDNNNIYKMLNEIPHKLIVNQNINGPHMKDVYNIHGNTSVYECPKCKTIYAVNSVINEDGSFNTECENCGHNIRPSVLLSGERYNNKMFNDAKEDIINSHTLMLIGMDYSETPLLDMIAYFGDVKSQVNATGVKDDEKVLVVLQSEDCKFNPSDITFPEFLVKGNIEEKLKILYENIQGC